MKCPECKTKLSTKHYDAAYEWFECPGCEGCFTYDEILEGVMAEDESGESEDTEAQGDRGRAKGKKAAGGRGKKRKDSDGENESVPARNGKARDHRGRTGIVAKGKKRRTEIEEDEEALAKFEKETLKPRQSSEPKHKKHRDEVDSVVVVNLWADEIQEIYQELDGEIDDANARDKATILWREIYLQGVSAREQSVPHALCEEHE